VFFLFLFLVILLFGEDCDEKLVLMLI